MSNAASQPSEKVAVVGVLDPQTVVNSEVFTDVIDLSKFHQCMGILALGNMASEAIDFAAYYCDSDGGNAVELKDIVQIGAHASTNDNTQYIINVQSQDLAALDKRYIKFGAVTGGASGGPACIIALGMVPRHGPASDNDLASVTQIVSE